MIYLDYGATSFHKPPAVYRAAEKAMRACANPGRGGYAGAMEAARTVFDCRTAAAELFSCRPDQVVFTTSCTHGLNIAIFSLVKPGGTVVVTGFEHNAVTRPLHALGAEIRVAGRRLFDWDNTLEEFDRALKGADAAVFTHVSNVFGYILPVGEMAAMCRKRGVPFILDAAQSAGMLEVNMKALGARFIAMPGHKGLLGPQGTGLLLCADRAEPLLYGGTGTMSRSMEMPVDLPERLEPGTANVSGAAGLTAGMAILEQTGVEPVLCRAHADMERAAALLARQGFEVWQGEHQAATVSFRGKTDCEEAARLLGTAGIACRAGLHCAPLAHESAGTLETGTVRLSFGYGDEPGWYSALARGMTKLS